MKYHNTPHTTPRNLLPPPAATQSLSRKAARSVQALIPTLELQRLVAGMVD